jgi:hypothetical protein
MPRVHYARYLLVILLCWAIFTLLDHTIIASFPVAHANTSNLTIYQPSSKPYGLSYGEWTAKWWQWIISIPNQNNPANDQTGINCAQKQGGPVWFLAGAVSGKAERNCVIKKGNAILFPIITSECSYAEFPKYKSEQELRACAVSQQDQVSYIEATVDGTAIQNLQKYRVQSPLFNVVFPSDNIFGTPPGPSQSVADGFYVFLSPLSPGIHNIHFKASNVDFTVTGTNSLAQDVIYHLTIN